MKILNDSRIANSCNKVKDHKLSLEMKSTIDSKIQNEKQRYLEFNRVIPPIGFDFNSSSQNNEYQSNNITKSTQPIATIQSLFLDRTHVNEHSENTIAQSLLMKRKETDFLAEIQRESKRLTVPTGNLNIINRMTNSMEYEKIGDMTLRHENGRLKLSSQSQNSSRKRLRIHAVSSTTNDIYSDDDAVSFAVDPSVIGDRFNKNIKKKKSNYDFTSNILPSASSSGLDIPKMQSTTTSAKASNSQLDSAKVMELKPFTNSENLVTKSIVPGSSTSLSNFAAAQNQNSVQFPVLQFDNKPASLATTEKLPDSLAVNFSSHIGDPSQTVLSAQSMTSKVPNSSVVSGKHNLSIYSVSIFLI